MMALTALVLPECRIPVRGRIRSGSRRPAVDISFCEGEEAIVTGQIHGLIGHREQSFAHRGGILGEHGVLKLHGRLHHQGVDQRKLVAL